MILPKPPAWLEALLSLLLAPQDRETISGDLLEEYRERRVSHLGSQVANLWFLRQVLSFASVRLLGGPPLHRILTFICLLGSFAGGWLLIMENFLKHDGYGQRSAIACCILLQGMATLFVLSARELPLLRYAVLIGAGAILWLGGSAIWRILQAPHFEGFVLLIGAILVLQGAITLLTLHRGQKVRAV